MELAPRIVEPTRKQSQSIQAKVLASRVRCADQRIVLGAGGRVLPSGARHTMNEGSVRLAPLGNTLQDTRNHKGSKLPMPPINYSTFPKYSLVIRSKFTAGVTSTLCPSPVTRPQCL
ncbi:hypothetical protein HG15A2_47870 [Adhaeretor mobilis]|uniref:Uncharacterized protein n=1 Tax=Adhaeretor mobilis TaxID=1930276 RepID=A0A517N2T4_9BACT|nr:hypothetical protein HG15A2_47870 [Adhaeretor mobilis]